MLSPQVEAEMPRLHSLARSILGSDDLAWDVVQEALVAFWRCPDESPGELRRLRGSVYYRSLRSLRSLSRRCRHEHDAVQARCNVCSPRDPSRNLEEAEVDVLVRSALAHLPRPFQSVLTLRVFGGLEYAEIAKRLRVPIGTVRSRLARTHALLRRRLEHLNIDGSLRDQRAPDSATEQHSRPIEPSVLAPGTRVVRRWLGRGCAGLLLVCLAQSLSALPMLLQSQAPATQSESEIETRALVRSTHTRIKFDKEIKRVAVGDPDLVEFEPLNDREVLVLGKDYGRTTLMVWFTDGSLKQYLLIVRRDISLLEAALKDINPSIVAEMAPDRDAVVLRGVVPDLTTSRVAEAAAQSYLDARSRHQDSAAQGLVAGSAPPVAPGVQSAPPAGGAEVLRAPLTVTASGKVINLLRLERLPLRPEEQLQSVLAGVGGADVRARRILRGQLPDDSKDILLLEGSVPDQIALVRVLSLAARTFVGESLAQDEIRVVADEAGALAGLSAGGGAQQGFQQSGNSSLGGVSFGLRSSSLLSNRIENSVGRAKALEVANGRIVSFIEVRDLPQVRIDIRVLEVNRTGLESFNSELAIIHSDFKQPSLNPADAAVAIQGPELAARPGASGTTDLQNALGFLSGSFTNQLQVSGGHVALNSLLTVLESRGIARTLSQPSLSVLSGEQAIFQVGGEIPIQTTETFANSTVVHVGTEFRQFGIQLAVRPLVGDDGTITLDVVPQVVTPDPELTKSIGQTTGAPPTTLAFDSRSLRTSARLRDGQVMVLGGLTTRSTEDKVSRTPWLASIPIIGTFFHGFSNQDTQQELVVIVNPIIVRQAPRNLDLWAFPDTAGLLWAPLAAHPVRKPAAVPLTNSPGSHGS